MKKFIALVLAVVLMSTIAATCFAAQHTHTYVYQGSWTEKLVDGYHEVAGCHNCTYRHTHTYSRTRTVYYFRCSCGADMFIRSAISNGPEYCPYSH